MDALRLLTRSIQKKPSSSTVRAHATPSAGPASNPQLFPDHSQVTRKRKRGSNGPEIKTALAPSLDFFGGASVLDGANKDESTKAPTTKTDPSLATAQPPLNEETPLSQAERKELLASHKIKVTLLRPARSEPAPAVQKKSKKKAKVDKAANKSRPQIYPDLVPDFRRLRSRYHLSRTLAQNIADQGYGTTTEVQLAALPLMLAPPCTDANSLVADPISIDLLTVAPTGSGKTLAFTIPLIQALLRDRHISTDAHTSSRAIILAPTKELASQICNEARKLALNTGIRVTTVRKGMHLAESSSPDATEDGGHVPTVKADLLVSTPAALLNALGTPLPDANTWSDFRYLILDEADVLLDPLFREQTLGVWNSLKSPALRVSFWSATMGSNIEELVQTTMQARANSLGEAAQSVVPAAPLVRLVVGLKDSAVPNVDHQLVYAATEQGKLMGLRQLLHPAPTGVNDQPVLRAPFLVFTQTIERAVALHSELQFDIPPEAGGISRISVLHSDLSETARDRVMTRFRKGEVWILITTDLLSRGVDFRGINGVVNYDVPTSAAAYVHRVGRTGRAGREGGVAVTYYTDDDVATIKTVANLIAAGQKLRGSGANSKDVQQWLLDALPTPSKRDKQQLKKRGIESRRSTAGKDSKTGAGKTRISTKSGYIRKMENNKRGAIAARQAQRDEDSGSEHSFGGFDD